MSQLLGVLIIVPEITIQVPVPILNSSQLPITLASKPQCPLLASVGTYTHDIYSHKNRNTVDCDNACPPHACSYSCVHSYSIYKWFQYCYTCDYTVINLPRKCLCSFTVLPLDVWSAMVHSRIWMQFRASNHSLIRYGLTTCHCHT